MKLFIKDRLYIPQMFASENSFMEYNLKRSIVSKITISEEDQKTFNIKEDAEHNRITWDIEQDKQKPLEVNFSKEEIDYLKKSCEQLAETPYPDDFWIVVEKIYNEAE